MLRTHNAVSTSRRLRASRRYARVIGSSSKDADARRRRRGRERLYSHRPMPGLVDRLTNPEQFDLRPTGPGSVLDVGCGSAKWPGAGGLDISAGTDADVVHDLDVRPYPFDDDSFDQILMQ